MSPLSELNRQPTVYDTVALPIELRGHLLLFIIVNYLVFMQINIFKNKKNLMRNAIKFSLFLFIFVSIFFLNSNNSNAAVSDNLSGKILLQVEKNGEAWYIKPSDKKRVFLGRPT